MRYRRFGKLDWEGSALGFGCMRLPTNDGRPMSGDIDEDAAIRLIRTAVDRGINYIDTAYPYHAGNSEAVTGKALGDGYRDRVRIATKSPVWLIDAPGDFDRYLGEQLDRLRTDRIDFYLFHALSGERWENIVLKHDLLRKAEDAVRDGRIGHIGFSFHDRYDALERIVTGYDGWSFCQLQYNYMDIDNQAGRKGMRLAAERGMAVVVMEPLLGGRLARPPAEVRQLFDEYSVKRSPAEWALRWLWDHPEVSVVLSGMSDGDQLEENLRVAGAAGAGDLAPGDLALVDRVRAKFLERAAIPCTRCGYCMPCPSGVDIPHNIELYNNGVIYDDIGASRFAYERFLGETERACACVQCGACVDKCPQGIRIGELMKDVSRTLAGKSSR